jgi:uncharacterized membrane protein YtjA (UPF0391 family)
MWNYAALFMVIALIAALLGFRGLAAGLHHDGAGPVLSFLALFLASLVMGWRRAPLQ